MSTQADHDDDNNGDVGSEVEPLQLRCLPKTDSDTRQLTWRSFFPLAKRNSCSGQDSFRSAADVAGRTRKPFARIGQLQGDCCLWRTCCLADARALCTIKSRILFSRAILSLSLFNSVCASARERLPLKLVRLCPSSEQIIIVVLQRRPQDDWHWATGAMVAVSVVRDGEFSGRMNTLWAGESFDERRQIAESSQG